jgi:hypothetical protein
MDARQLQLLQSIEARGGVATVKHGGGAASINVASRSLALELLPDLQRFKPALLELLAHGDRYPTGSTPEAEPLPLAPPEVTSAARARGVAVTSYCWPVCYWSGDYAEELKTARSRKENHA